MVSMKMPWLSAWLLVDTRRHADSKGTKMWSQREIVAHGTCLSTPSSVAFPVSQGNLRCRADRIYILWIAECWNCSRRVYDKEDDLGGKVYKAPAMTGSRWIAKKKRRYLWRQSGFIKGSYLLKESVTLCTDDDDGGRFQIGGRCWNFPYTV